MDLLEVKIESMFDNGKGRMIQRTDIFSSCGYICAGIWWGLEDEQVNQDLEGEGVGSREWREEVG